MSTRWLKMASLAGASSIAWKVFAPSHSQQSSTQQPDSEPVERKLAQTGPASLLDLASNTWSLALNSVPCVRLPSLPVTQCGSWQDAAAKFRAQSAPQASKHASWWRQQPQFSQDLQEIAPAFTSSFINGSTGSLLKHQPRLPVSEEGTDPLLLQQRPDGLPKEIFTDHLEEGDIRKRMETFTRALQEDITRTIEWIEAQPLADDVNEKDRAPARFRREIHYRDGNNQASQAKAGGGGGVTMVLEDGRVWSKAGCNVSVLFGKLTARQVSHMCSNHAALKKQLGNNLPSSEGDQSEKNIPYFACGCSTVLHPRNPHVPTTHLNYRYFEVEVPLADGTSKRVWWFGGGSDLTPIYVSESGDAERHFHQVHEKYMRPHGEELYPQYKEWADKYFYLPHRQEGRGVGGIFFDDVHEVPPNAICGSDVDVQDRTAQFQRSCAAAFTESYFPLVWKYRQEPWTEKEKRWQQLRRGRYAEFNLVIDRGTKFGLALPSSRTEAILMSLPLTCRFQYAAVPDWRSMLPHGEDAGGVRNRNVAPGTTAGWGEREAITQKIMEVPQEWL